MIVISSVPAEGIAPLCGMRYILGLEFLLFFFLLFRRNMIMIHYRQKYGISGKHNGNTRIWHFDLLAMAWRQPQNFFVTLMQLSRVVLWAKMKLAMPAIKDTQPNLQECVICNTSHKIYYNSQGIHNFIVNLWQFCVGSIIRYRHHAKFVTGCRITISVLKQNGRKVWLRALYLVSWYPIENLLQLSKF